MINPNENQIRTNALEDIKSGKFSKRDEIADVQIYQIEGITYGLPINSTPELRRCFATAILAYRHKASFEEVLSKQNIEEYEDDKWTDPYLEIGFLIATGMDFMLEVSVDLYNCLRELKHNMHSGEFIYFNAMTRLRESFKSAIILRDRGFYVEMMPILRLIYEQLCWCCYAIDEKDPEKLKNNWKTQNTKYLKEKINPEYGRLYSLLSNEAHMAPIEMYKYLDIDEETNTINVKGRSGKESKKDMIFIVQLYKIFLQVFEYGVKHFKLECEDYYSQLYMPQIDLADQMIAVCEGKQSFKFKMEIRV